MSRCAFNLHRWRIFHAHCFWNRVICIDSAVGSVFVEAEEEWIIEYVGDAFRLNDLINRDIFTWSMSRTCWINNSFRSRQSSSRRSTVNLPIIFLLITAHWANLPPLFAGRLWYRITLRYKHTVYVINLASYHQLRSDFDS